MASTVSSALCLDGLVPVPSGLAVELDGGPAPRYVRESQAPEGVVQIHLGSGALGASRVIDALLRQHPATVARMVEVLSPELTRRITRGEVDGRGRAHGLPVDLPGRADLLVPGDDRILPMDAAGRVTTAGAATGVRVLPERHLLDRSPLVTATAEAPRLPAMHGQVRLSPDAMAIGLPSALVAARHGGLADVRPTDAVTVAAAGPADLIRQLDLLTPGQRAVVDVRRTEDAQPETFHIVRDPDGLGVLAFVGGTPTGVNFPRTAFPLDVSLPSPPAGVAANATTRDLVPARADPREVAEPVDARSAPPASQLTVTPPVEVVPAAPETTLTPLPGTYTARPELLHEVDSIPELEALIDGIVASVNAAVHDRIAGTWKSRVPLLAQRPVNAQEIVQALRAEPESFFVTGGRSFDVRDAMHGWHRVTITPLPADEATGFISQEADKAKFDTRADSLAVTQKSDTVGGAGSLGVSTMLPQRVGYGAGGGFEVALSRPLETFEFTTRVTDSHNIRSGGASHLLERQVVFLVHASDIRSPVLGPQAAPGTRGPDVVSPVIYRSVDDIANATVREPDLVPIDPARHTPLLVETLTPVRILRAGVNGAPATSTWNDVAEELLVRLGPSKAVEPGSVGRNQARGLLSESSIIAKLVPGLEGAVHPALISSAHNAHALSLDITATLPRLGVLADIPKSSFRHQPGLTAGSKLEQASRVGGAINLVPVRWAWGTGYVQLRLFAGSVRTMTASATSGGTTRVGTEFKDIRNVAVEAHFRLVLTPALREVPGSRNPFAAVPIGPTTVDLVVLCRMPLNKAAELLSGTGTVIPAPLSHVPPYAMTGGRSVTYGLSAFTQLRLDVISTVRAHKGGFLPKFTDPGKVTRMAGSKSAIERLHNQSELDRVLHPGGWRAATGTILKTGLIAQLIRTRPFGTEHMVVHVTGRYTRDFVHQGTEQRHAVRNATVDGAQQKIIISGQRRIGASVESGGVLRVPGPVSSALVPGGALEVRRRLVRRSATQLSGQQIRLNGGTPDSEAFDNELELTVHIYSYVTRLGHDPRSVVKVGRTVHQRLPRPTGDAQRYTRELVPGTRFRQITRLRLSQRRPVTVLFDRASVTDIRHEYPVTFQPRPDPVNVHRRTPLERGTLRTWVDHADGQPAKVDVLDWLSVDDLPASPYVLQLARDALRDAQTYGAELTSRTKLGGLRGTDSLDEGMEAWAALTRRFADHEQVSGLRSMLNGQWTVDKVLTSADGAAVDLTVTAALINSVLVPTTATPVATESATVGGASVEGARTAENQLILRAGFSANMRKSGTGESTSGGGGLLSVTHEWLLYSRAVRRSFEIGGVIERNANNRKGKMRSYLVKFDMRVSVAAEITTDPARYAILPQAMRFGDWLHHFKSTERHGTMGNAIYLRLAGEEVQRLGLLRPLTGDTGSFGAPWSPGPDTQLRLPPGHGVGLGLYTFRETPNLTDSMIKALSAAAESADAGTGRFTGLLDVLRGRAENVSLAKISKSVSRSGLDDPMLNRRRLLQLLTPDGVAAHWSSLVDGGVSVLHMKPGKTTQHSRDIRLVAEPCGKPIFEGFVASHDDIDVKLTHISDAGTTIQQTHGHTDTLGVAGTGVANHHGENLAAGLGDTAGRSSQVANTQGTGQTATNMELSSARGVKARLRFPVRFSLVIFDNGTRIDSDLLVVDDFVTQDRWADDLRLPRTVGPGDELAREYVIRAPESMDPGWRTVNGLPLPPRFTPEEISRLAELQTTVEDLLEDAAERLKTPGRGGAHQIHHSLTPEILLPAVPKMMTTAGMDLPSVVSAQLLGQHAKINLRIVPEGVALHGVSSGVFREHASATTAGYSAGTDSLVQSLRAPRLPILGRGFTNDAYQGLEHGGPGLLNGDQQGATEAIGASAGPLGNVKPESASAALDYLSRVEVTITLAGTIGSAPRTITGTETTTVTLRMGLHDARTALGIPTTTDPTGRAAAFDEIARHETGLAKAADHFTAAADNLDAARFEAHFHPEGSAGRTTAEAALPELIATWEEAGREWWSLEQRHYDLLDDFRQRFLGVSPAAAHRPGALAQRIRTQFLNSVEQPPEARAPTSVEVVQEPPVTTPRFEPSRETSEPIEPDHHLPDAATIDSPGTLLPGEGPSRGFSSPADSDLAPEPEWLQAALDRHLNRPAEDAPNLVTNAGTTARVPKTLINAARKRPDLWIYFHEAKRGDALDARDRSAIHQRLEQFAQAGVRPLVFTPGRPSLDVLSVLDAYGVTLLSEVPAGLGTAWKATAHSRSGALVQSPEITAGLLDSAVAASGAAPKFNRVSESFGSLVWASNGLRDQQRKITNAPSEYHTPENLRAADEMATRMPDSAMAHLVKPLLELGPVSDVVPRYVEAPKKDRPSVLLEELQKLELAGHLVDGTGTSTTGLVWLVEATGRGVNDQAALGEIRFTTGILQTLDAISSGRWDDAQDFVSNHKGMTDADQKVKWAQAISDRQRTSTDPGERLHLQNLISAVFEC
ncbi:hypothetical protein MRQ36_01785 [Micromonospora sp. R77]|uniref:hypothetical protein n=1 Tax=Micromonospora sp. R77 TaxID=2925836 RepID=UPI001F61A915|nr:hypothetical protein [Micromonospora sp. R77]MCI4061371.1 hypothetical protein [Micromonospora sp. R77]